jgi:hypothetical protein
MKRALSINLKQKNDILHGEFHLNRKNQIITDEI